MPDGAPAGELPVQFNVGESRFFGDDTTAADGTLRRSPMSAGRYELRARDRLGCGLAQPATRSRGRTATARSRTRGSRSARSTSHRVPRVRRRSACPRRGRSSSAHPASLQLDQVVGEALPEVGIGVTIACVKPRLRRSAITATTLSGARRVERRCRLVEQQHLRLGAQRARDRDALGFAAGQPRREPRDGTRHADEPAASHAPSFRRPLARRPARCAATASRCRAPTGAGTGGSPGTPSRCAVAARSRAVATRHARARRGSRSATGLTVPVSWRSSWLHMRSKVLLPLPLRPMITVVLPGTRSRSRPENSTRPP